MVALRGRQTIDEATRASVLKRDQLTCQACGNSPASQVHHIKAQRHGGDEKLSNLVTLCGRCHMIISPEPPFALYRAFGVRKSEISDEKKRIEKAIKHFVDVASENGSSENSETTSATSVVWTVSQLTHHIRLALKKQFHSLMLEGELSNFIRSSQGHLYFRIKDSQTQIQGVMFRQAASTLKFAPENGLEVIVRGHIAVYEPKGEYQIQISSMEPIGLGSFQLAFQQLKEKLQQEGVFDSKHKQVIPFFPRRIGIVTSANGTAAHDMLHVLNRRCPVVSVLLYPVAVQGEQAVPSLVAAIQYLNSLQETHQIDVMIVGRAGGSTEDLWAFNDETLARAIFTSKIPVISAVGHETDVTIADFVSDLRAPTPSAAMELAVPLLQDILYKLKLQEQRLQREMQQRIRQNRELIHAKTQQLRAPDFIIHLHKQRLNELSFHLHHLIIHPLRIQQINLPRLHEQLILLNPLQMQQNNLARLEARLNYLHEKRLQKIQNDRLALKMTITLSVSIAIIISLAFLIWFIK